MKEYAFELALCAHLESPDAILSRQLGAHVHGHRVIDIVRVEPGPGFDDRAAITPAEIPALALESNVGPGTARPVSEAFDCHPERAREVADRAVELGFFERERRGGRSYVRQAVRYPEDWIGPIVGVENKPDLDRPGDLETQLLTDVGLALLDEVVLATNSYVTGAHLNRLPDPVGVWRFHPDTGEREVVREPEPLTTAEAGIEILDRTPGRADIRVASPAAKARARRRLAERAYGKGWRPADYPACVNCEPDADGLPYCAWADRVVHPGAECGSSCSGFEAADAPDVDVDGMREEESAWVADPEGRSRRQSGLHRFS